MAITVTPDMTIISLCEDTTNWSIGVTNDAFKKQGTYCLGLKVSEAESVLITYTFPSAVDMSNGEHVFIWMQIQGIPDTKANGGMRMYVEDGLGNYGYWNVGGSDNYAGGWFCFVIDPASTPTSGSGTIDTSDIAKVGLRFKTLSKALGNSPNCFWDACRYGKGLKITSGPSDGIDLDDIFTEDDNVSNCYGVISKINNVFFGQGKLIFGDISSGDIDFKDISQLIVFKDNPFVADDFYEIIVQGNASGTTNFQFGNKSGDAGIQGCVLKSAGTKTFKFTATDTDIDVLKIYGSSFLNAGVISLPPNATGREVISCNFVECEEVIADTCIVTYCKFVSADDRGVRIADLTNHNITKCDFISCVHGVHCNVAGNVNFDALMFSGNTYDVEFSVSGTLNVSKLNGSNPSTEDSPLGDVNFLLSVTLKVIVKDEAGSPIENAQVGIFRQSNMDQLMNEDTLATGIAEETFDYGAGPDVDIYLRIRKSSVNGVRYTAIATIGTITSSGFTYYAVLIEDKNIQ